MPHIHLPSYSSQLLFLTTLYFTCLYIPTYSSENFEKPLDVQSVSLQNTSSTLSVQVTSYKSHSSTASDNASLTSPSLLPFSSSTSSSSHSKPPPKKVPTSKDKRLRRHTDNTSNFVGDVDGGDEEDRVPYGPIWTGSRESVACVGCDYKEIMRRNRIELIKEDLLRRLKMVAPPNITSPIHIQNFMQNPHAGILSRHHGYMNGPYDDPHTIPEAGMQSDAAQPDPEDAEDLTENSDKSTTMRVFNFCQGTHSNSSYISGLIFDCTFKFQSHIESMEVVNASIGVYVERSPNLSQRLHRTSLGPQHRHHSIDSSRSHGHPPGPTVYLDRLHPDGKAEGFSKKRAHFGSSNGIWLGFEAKSLVQSWLSEPELNFGIRLRLVPHQRDTGTNRIISPYSIERDSDDDLKPFVDVALKDPPRSQRNKRSVASETCEEHPEGRECCRYSLVINFAEYGWDFILQPRSYNAYYCAGFCPPAMKISEVHGHIMQQASESNLCCSPKSYSPLRIIYTDIEESTIINKQFPGMITDRCGCS